jgi:hypothetical protein
LQKLEKQQHAVLRAAVRHPHPALWTFFATVPRRSHPVKISSKVHPIAWIALLVFLGVYVSASAFAEISNIPQTLVSRQVNGGNVLPPIATPKGYSLSRMAKATAYFNTSNREGIPPDTPFQILYSSASNNNAFEIAPGTMLYVPVIFNDDSPPVIGGEENFPATGNRKALLNYFYSKEFLGLVFTEIVVDGTVSSLGSDYLVQVTVQKLADGSGTRYQTIAAFLTPLTEGVHEVEIRAKATGNALSVPPFDQVFPGGVFEFSTTYKVTVR